MQGAHRRCIVVKSLTYILGIITEGLADLLLQVVDVRDRLRVDLLLYVAPQAKMNACYCAKHAK